MDMRSWKKVLLQWITECGFMDRNYFNIEQSEIDVFYKNYISQHQRTDSDKYESLGDFLKDFYPSCDINLDDENCISSADYIYVYSLLLHYCCVKQPETLFHQICQKLPVYAQQYIASFFKELLDTEPITKEALRHAIAEVVNTQSPPPRLNDSLSAMNITGSVSSGQSSTSFYRCESPLKTPKRSAGPHRVSPSTPKTNLLEERTRDVYNLRAQLETERYEKGLLEVQIKQNEDKIYKLNHDHKRLLQQIQDLKNDIIVISSDGSTNREGEENQVQKRLLKELYQREQEIIKLSDIAITLREEKTLIEEKLNYAEKKIVICMNRIKELDFKLIELTDDVEKKNDTIKYLTNSKMELEQFISNNRMDSSDHTRPDLNASTDCFDNSYIRGGGGNNTNSSNSLSSPENLGAAVVDIQLREKEHENHILKEELLNVKRVHKRLAYVLTKLTYDIAKPEDAKLSLEDDYEDKNENEECEIDETVSCEEQFFVFNNCLQKINKYHETEKIKVKRLEEASKNMYEENDELRRKLGTLNEQLVELKEKQLTKEKCLEELQKSKRDVDNALEKSRKDFVQLQAEKQALYSNLQSSETLKESLNKVLNELATQLEELKINNTDLTTQNRDLKYSRNTSQTEIQGLQQKLSTKTLHLEEEIQKLSNKVAEQIEELYSYQQMEKTLKKNYEQIMIENELLKKQERESNIHLSSMKEELLDKDKQMSKLADQIADITQKNNKLEENINRMLEKCEQDNQIRNNLETNQQEHVQELEKNITKLKDDLCKAELLFESKQHECELKIQLLETVKPKIQAILKLFGDSEINDAILNNLLEIETKVKSLLKENKETNDKFYHLETTHLEASFKIEELQLKLKEKSDVIKQNSHSMEELLTLRKLNSEYEEDIANLKQQQLSFIAQVQLDVEKKELELQERLKEAAAEYENSLERVGHELKMEKEQQNNKEMELLLLKAEHNEIKKQLSEKVENIKKLQDHCELLKVYEVKVIECSAENENLRQEIENFKQEVTQNALRLLEADKALTEFMDLTKEQDTSKTELEKLKKSLNVKEETILELENQAASYADEINRLQEEIQAKLDSISVLHENLDKLTSDKEKVLHTLEEKQQQIQREQQDKIVLLNSLEKTTDQLKMVQEDNTIQKLALEQEFAELKEQFESNKELESIDMAVMEIVAIMENNFNLSQETKDKDVNNVFKFEDDVKGAGNIQKLRKNLNNLLFSQQKLQQELQDLSLKNEEASISLKQSNTDLQSKLNQQEKILSELTEQLDTDQLINEKRLSQEVKRLEDDILNLENVNERLTQENVNIHVTLDDVQQEFKESKNSIDKLEEDKLKLKEEIRCKTLALEKLQQEEKKLQQSLKEKCQNIEKVSEKSKSFENQLKEKTAKLQNLEKFCHDLKEKSQKTQQKLLHYQTQHQSQQAEHKKLQEKIKHIQISNEALESDVTKKNKDLLALTNKYAEVTQQLEDVEQELQMSSKKLDEMLTHKLNAETQCEQLISEKQQLKRDLEFITSQQLSQQEEHSRLNHEIESIKQDKQHLRDEIKEIKLSLQMANDNVSQLIQQISSIRLEKEATLAEHQLLRKQLEETGKHQSSSETKLKTIIEKSQDFERKLLSTENELKSLKVQLEKSETSTEKLSTENKKLRDSQEVATKRVEKLSLKLGESQARSAKLERDNEKLGKTLDANSATVEALQKEKDFLQSEAKSLKERLSRAERGHEQLAVKIRNLEHLNANLQETKQKLEASELDGKTKLNKLEKMRIANEEKIRKLTATINNAEHNNVKLNLEIGALNSQLQEIKTDHNQEQLQHQEELKQQLEQAQDQSHRYEQLNEKLHLELHQMKEENSFLNDQLSKASLSLDITKQRCEKMASEMEQIRADMLIIRQEKSQVELQHETSMQKLTQFESQNTKLLYERKSLVKSLEQRISSLEEELAAKSKEVDDLQNEIQTLKENSETHSSFIQQTHTASLSELQQLQSKLLLADETIQKEQQVIAQLRLDNQILHTKYKESKQRALDAATNSEERIKENRLELEGKLEKMKNKMKTLYTEEITKMKTKQEREVALIKSELEVNKTQNAKYEEHTRKLSNQIVRLNENILEHQKENTMLSTKLKHIMEQQQQHHECDRFKRPSSIHVSSISCSAAPVAAANNIGTNLAMEDEEGEVFNNTYLTDLKNGRMSELMGRDVCVEELKYRNSLLPPHLRSTYAAQYDHEFPEDDLKDGPHSFDDSMSALLSTTAGGTRKKCTGVTHYKRPGPPTPSKNGGRLSFGGSSEPCREILKESYDTNAGSSAVSSTKTPARFNFFASRFSMGNTRDENTPPRRRLSNMFKRK